MSLQLLFPREFATGETGLQPSVRVSGSRNTVVHSYTNFSHIVRCEAGSVFTHLGPNKFNRIELWSIDRKIIHIHTRILGKKLLHELTFVDGMVVPHQNYLARNNPQHPLQDSDHLFAPQTAPIRARGQLAPVAVRPDQQCTQQVQPLVMLQAGAEDRRLSTWRPTALEQRDQRETAFIFKYQRGSQFTPLFLSLARPAAPLVGSPHAVSSGCSNSCEPSHAKHHWQHTEFRIARRLRAQSVPARLLHWLTFLCLATPAPPSAFRPTLVCFVSCACAQYGTITV